MTFGTIKIGLASPDKTPGWSHDEMKEPETTNCRTFKPGKDGLFYERVFRPGKDWECHCGKYKKIRYKGIICDHYGAEVTKASVCRERIGHIKLAAPVSHIWYFRGIPNRVSLTPDTPPRTLEKMLYFASYIILGPGSTSLQYKQVLSEKGYREEVEKHGGTGDFRVGMGAEVIQGLPRATDLEKGSTESRRVPTDSTGQECVRIVKRLEVVEAFLTSDSRSE